MLGEFLELSVSARPLTAAYEFYRALGFRSVPVGDILPGPYAVLFDGSIAIGLSEREAEVPVPTFVRPDLKAYARGVRRLGIELQYARFADDEFHEAGFADPNGQPVRLIEARTSARGTWDHRNVSACGAFLEFSVATDSLERSRAFWEKLGFAAIAAGESPHEWLRLSGHGFVLGLHRTSRFRAGLSFKSRNLPARIEYLIAKGFEPKRGGPLAEHKRQSATLIAPEGTALYLLDHGGAAI